jgi:hypothetical protein
MAFVTSTYGAPRLSFSRRVTARQASIISAAFSYSERMIACWPRTPSTS